MYYIFKTRGNPTTTLRGDIFNLNHLWKYKINTKDICIYFTTVTWFTSSLSMLPAGSWFTGVLTKNENGQYWIEIRKKNPVFFQQILVERYNFRNRKKYGNWKKVFGRRLLSTNKLHHQNKNWSLKTLPVDSTNWWIKSDTCIGFLEDLNIFTLFKYFFKKSAFKYRNQKG